VHLGNWEFGGPCLTRKGVPLQVLTLAEPGDRFTALRQASRARWKVDTLVVRNDPFAFLEPMRRLESGATVALLIDRPPPPTAVEARLFGQTIHVSNAAAELARASGCVVLPVAIWRENGAYSVRVMPPVTYERARLRDRGARQQFTQQIIECFAPLIAEHPDQWYHFVPVWPNTEQKQ
jgi:lauroyl/myristoyl acyltransferase